MKVFSFATAAVAALIVFASQDAKAQYCNSSEPRCVVDLGFDNNNSITACLDTASTSTSCTANCAIEDGFGGCALWMTRYNSSCLYFFDCDFTTRAEGQVKEEFNTCGTNGAFCGWRDSVNKSGGGSSNSARAKLHSCAANGYNDESNYNTTYSCTNSINSANLYCDDSVWDSLCNSAGWSK